MKNRLLIIEDNDQFRQMIKSFLYKQDWDLEIFEASTGEMGVAKAACVKPHVILMDINLPKADGFRTTLQIKMDNPETKIIFLTMFEVEAFKKKARELDAADFIGKSEIYDRLIPAVKRCFKKRKVRR